MEYICTHCVGIAALRCPLPFAHCRFPFNIHTKIMYRMSIIREHSHQNIFRWTRREKKKKLKHLATIHRFWQACSSAAAAAASKAVYIIYNSGPYFICYLFFSSCFFLSFVLLQIAADLTWLTAWLTGWSELQLLHCVHSVSTVYLSVKATALTLPLSL